MAFEAIGYVGLWVNSRSFDYLSNKSYLNIRAMLIGDTAQSLYPRYLSLPYLGYIPYPGFRKNGVVQHNQDGYRGDRVPQERTGKFRVLCLGGSTTYGFGVDAPSQTYPAQLEKILNAYIGGDSLAHSKYSGAEVINAGIEDATSAEELEQYLFKYRYYRPDVVIVHSGINDALLVAHERKDFQMDYTHYRRINFHLEPLRQPARFLMHSYFVSFIVIRLFYSDFANASKNEFQHYGHQTFCRWTMTDIDSVINTRQYEYYPFYNNCKCLCAEVIRDSSILILFPNAVNENVSDARYKQLCELNASLSQRIANDYGAIYVPFSFRSIDSALWIDDCHLNKEGETKKAELLAPLLIRAIESRRQ
jgi:lysophospholipase L1-like esterase